MENLRCRVWGCISFYVVCIAGYVSKKYRGIWWGYLRSVYSNCRFANWYVVLSLSRRLCPFLHTEKIILFKWTQLIVLKFVYFPRSWRSCMWNFAYDFSIRKKMKNRKNGFLWRNWFFALFGGGFSISRKWVIGGPLIGIPGQISESVWSFLIFYLFF